MAWNICLNRGTAGGGMPLEDFVRLASTAGFRGADVDPGYGVDHSPAALQDLYARHDALFGGWGAPDWRSDESKLNDALPRFEKSAAVAAQLGIDSCSTWIMPSSDLPLVENFRFHVARLSRVASVLGRYGLRLGLEFVSPYHLRRQLKHEFLFTPGQMLELAEACGTNVGLLVDAFHLHCAGVPMSAVADIPRDKIVLCHFNDAPRVPVHEVQDSVRLLPGEGAIDLAGFFGSLARIGYTGVVSLEVFSNELKSMSPEQAAAKAAGACRTALAPLGGW